MSWLKEKYFTNSEIAGGMEIEDAVMTATQKEKAIMETPFQKNGLDLIWYGLVFFLVLLVGRVVYLDVIRAQHYAELSKGNRIRKIVVPAPRGKIMDKFGSVLVRNVPSIDVTVVPRDLPENYEERQRVIAEIVKILDLDLDSTSDIVESQNRKSLDAVLLRENITQEQALIISERTKQLAGIVLENTAIRNYENSLIFAPLMGYDGKITKTELEKNPGYLMTDYIGKAGLEKSYEKYLHGVNGARQVEVDSLGSVKKDLGIIEPQAGKDLILNVDEGLQKKMYDSLTGILENTQTKTAAAIAIDPRNGGVLGLVSLPSYDNNLFAQGIGNDDYRNIVNDKNLPLLNRPVSGEYPPGSTFKMSVAAAALTEGTISPETTLDTGAGAITIGSWRFGDWKTHGMTDVRLAIAQSNDIFFYALGGGYAHIAGLGIDRIKKYANLFGFGSPTGIDLPNEASGFIPDENWKRTKMGERWYIGDSYHASIGQGSITTTPVQLAAYVASIANGGTLYTPRVVNRIKASDGQDEYIAPQVSRKDFVAPEILRIVREGMRQTVTDGTAQSLKELPVAVAGKTGTAQFGVGGKQMHAWFVSFAPYDNPEIAMVILVEGGGEGSSSPAVAATKDVLNYYFSRAK